MSRLARWPPSEPRRSPFDRPPRAAAMVPGAGRTGTRPAAGSEGMQS